MTSRTVKILLTVLLLVALGSLVDWGTVFYTLLQVRPGWLGIASLWVMLARFVITWRWQVVLRAIGYHVSFRRLQRVVSAGIGLGSLLPTSVGPDLARGVLLRKDSGEDNRIGTGVLVSSLVFDRYAATLGTLLVAGMGAVWVGQFVIAAVLALAFVLAVAFAIAIARYSTPLILALTPGPLRKLAPKLEAMATYLRQPHIIRQALLPAMFISALLTVVRVAIFVSLYRSFGYVAPVGLSLFVIPTMLIALMAPVTIGGFGLREWLLAIGFADIGIPAEVSVSVGLLAFVVQVLVSLPAITRTMMLTRVLPAGRPVRNGET